MKLYRLSFAVCAAFAATGVLVQTLKVPRR